MAEHGSKDRDLVQLYLSRSEEATAVASERYGKLLHGICAGILPDERDAQECVNETLLRLWQSIPPTIPRSFSAFACRTARNCALDRKKSEERQKRSGALLSSEDDFEQLFSEEDLPEEQILAGELRVILDRFLERLPRRAREIFLLRFWFALPAKSVAEKLGVTERAVHLSLASTKEKLRILLKKEGYIE